MKALFPVARAVRNCRKETPALGMFEQDMDDYVREQRTKQETPMNRDQYESFEKQRAMQAMQDVPAGRSTASEVRKQSPFYTLNDAVQRADTLAREIAGLADAIAGYAPHPVPDPMPPSSARDAGQIPSLADAALGMASVLTQANADVERALKRIRDVLP